MQDLINIAIVDDEKIQTELLQKYVQNWAAKNNITAAAEVFFNAESFEFKWSMNKKYNILLLDIQMSGQNGMELAKKIRHEDDTINIIFITALTDYIAEGYDVSAINYLIKPVKENRLNECLNKACLKIPKEEKAIIINEDGQTYKIKISDIVFIEAFAHSIEINTLNTKYTTRKNISIMEKELDSNMFIRCHRSYIVGLRYIKKISNAQLEMDNGKAIPISRRQYAKTNMAFIKYFRGDLDE